MKMGCGTSVRGFARGSRSKLSRLKKSLKRPKQGFDRIRFVLQAAALDRQFALTADEILPRFVVTSQVLVQSPACELSLTSEGFSGIDERDGVFVFP